MNTRKTKISLLLAIGMIFSMAMTAGATAISPTEEKSIVSDLEQTQIEKFFQDYFDCISEIYVDFDYKNTNLNAFYDSTTTDNVAQNRDLSLIKLRMEHYKLQKSDLRWKSFENKNQVNDIIFDGKFYTINLIRSYSATYHQSDFEASAAIEHSFTLIKSDSGFKITAHDYYDDFELALAEYLPKSDEISFNDNNLSYIQNAIDKYIEFANEYNFSNEPEDISQPPELKRYNFTSYNRDAAINYAHANLHPPYGDPNYVSVTYDCTNYTSRCLNAGGIPQIYSGSYQWYWRSRSDRSYSWTDADGFRNYYQNNGSGINSTGLYAYQTSYARISRGDIGQLVSEGHASHSFIFLRTAQNGWDTDWIILQHQPNGSFWLSEKPANLLEYVRIEGYHY